MGLIAVTAVSTAIWLNPPSGYRSAAFDRKRLDNLRSIDKAVKDYFKKHEALPADLEMLDKEKNDLAWDEWHDPETKLPYEYKILEKNSFQLCAVFSQTQQTNADYGHYYSSPTKHGAGHDCFDYQIKISGKQSE